VRPEAAGVHSFPKNLSKKTEDPPASSRPHAQNTPKWCALHHLGRLTSPDPSLVALARNAYRRDEGMDKSRPLRRVQAARKGERGPAWAVGTVAKAVVIPCRYMSSPLLRLLRAAWLSNRGAARGASWGG